MNIIIRQARIFSPGSPHHGLTKDIFISNGIIKDISDVSSETGQIIDFQGISVSVGWADIFSHFEDSGHEYRETIATGAAAAASGGFTDVMLIPNTNPPVSTKAQVEYLAKMSDSLPINIYPIAAISANINGKDLAEMYDLRSSGAVAFSDGLLPVQNPGLLLKALQYVLPMDATIIQLPDDKSIQPRGQMNEGITSTKIGLSGKPALSEELMIARDIELLRYTGSKLHITGISTAKSLEMITAAKHEGLNITCSATAYHCIFTDDQLESYDTNLKVNPPLRNASDRDAIKQGLITGNIDCIAAHHLPLHNDDKRCEFEHAAFGMENLETVFGAINAVHPNLDELINTLTIKPRKIFGLPIPMIKEGEKACLTLFNPNEEYIFDKSNIHSRSFNNAFIGMKLKGRVLGIINKGQTILNK